MAYLKISNRDYTLGLIRISGYDLSCFSLKNQYTGEAGNTIVYPVRMQKKRISVTAEIYADEYHIFENIMKSVMGYTKIKKFVSLKNQNVNL